MGLSNIEFTELTNYISIPTLERLPDDKWWLIPLCVIHDDRLCKMRFMYESLGEFVKLIPDSTMYEIGGNVSGEPIRLATSARSYFGN